MHITSLATKPVRTMARGRPHSKKIAQVSALQTNLRCADLSASELTSTPVLAGLDEPLQLEQSGSDCAWETTAPVGPLLIADRTGAGALLTRSDPKPHEDAEIIASNRTEDEPLGVVAEPEQVMPEPGARRRGSYDGDSSFTLYLREIGQVKLLTPQEEIALAIRIKQGDKKAREEMIKANLRLVVKIARDYEGIGLPLMDLISEGNIGLMKAVERFDPAKGAKLSTYACWWIKQSIKRALANQSKTIRLPVHLVDKISKMRRCALSLQDALGREPTDEEVAAELGVPAARITQLRMAASRPASLDGPVAGEDTASLGELVQDENAESPCEQLEEKSVLRILHQMLQSLPPREARILRARFGLDGASETSLDEIGRSMGVTRERIRQLQQSALNKLRKMVERIDPTAGGRSGL